MNQRKAGRNMNRLEEAWNATKVAEYLKSLEETERKKQIALVILAAVGVILAIVGVVIAVTHLMKPDYLDDFEDELEDDFEDDFEDDIVEADPEA